MHIVCCATSNILFHISNMTSYIFIIYHTLRMYTLFAILEQHSGCMSYVLYCVLYYVPYWNNTLDI